MSALKSEQSNIQQEFSYEVAFSRSRGWLTENDLNTLRSKTVAIAGMGGVGGQYAITLARLGIGNFKISDFDEFEVHNFNRQHASSMKTIGQKKVEVILEEILSVNPEAKVEVFPDGVNSSNVDEFLSGVDVYMDGLDIFALEARQLVFKSLEEKGIPGITVGPIGMGASQMVFTTDSMSFEKYFNLNTETTLTNKMLKFLINLTPSAMQAGYMADKDAVDIDKKKVPSTPMGVTLCAGIASTTCLKLLLGRGKIYKAPWTLHYDAYLNKYKKTYTPFGCRNPLSRFRFWFVKKFFKV